MKTRESTYKKQTEQKTLKQTEKKRTKMSAYAWTTVGGKKKETKMAPACKHGDGCRRENCYFSHPSGQNRPGLKAPSCRYNDDCRNHGCHFSHPSGQNRHGLQQKKAAFCEGSGLKPRAYSKPDARKRAGPKRNISEHALRDIIDHDKSNGYHLIKNVMNAFKGNREYLIHYLLTCLAKTGDKVKFIEVMAQLDKEKGWSVEERAEYLQDFTWHRGELKKIDSIICHAAFAASKDLLEFLIRYPGIKFDRKNKWNETLEECLIKSWTESKNVQKYKTKDSKGFLGSSIKDAIREIKSLAAKNKAWEEAKAKAEEEKKNAPKKMTMSELMALKRKQRAEAAKKSAGELTA